MLAPAPARPSAIARPRPAVAPVTSAHLPFIAAIAPLLLVELGEDFLGVPERIHARRHAAIDRDLHEHLADFLLGGAVGECAADVGLQLVRAIERAEHRQVQEAAGLACQALAAPDVAP